VTLRFGVERLQQDFNQESDALRVLAVLSPTCPNCLEGYEMMTQMSAGPTCLVLWTAMIEGDSAHTATQLIGSDRRCAHYWEDEGWPLSTRLRPVLGFGPYDPQRSVWDVYLLYPPGILWADVDPPLPTDWTHNLRGHETGRSRITAALLTQWASTAMA
jgi:hypothetical protein